MTNRQTSDTFYDFIIIGGGHNGLVAAALLAKSGNKVLVAEERQVLGGAAATEQIWPGYFVNTGCEDAGLFRPEIAGMLELDKLGLEFIDAPASAVALLPDGPPLILTPDMSECQEAIARISAKDSESFPEFVRMLGSFGGILGQMGFLTPPNISGPSLELAPWLKSIARFKRQGRREVLEFGRALPMSIHGFLNEWFEDEGIKGLLAGPALTGIMQGPMAPGTVINLIYRYEQTPMDSFLMSRFVRGGMGKLSDVIAESARMNGAEIRVGKGVSKIMLEEGAATGIILSDGEEIHGGRIISNADPYQTLIRLVGPQNLGPQFVRKVRNIRFRGVTAKLVLALKELPQCPALSSDPNLMCGRLVICPSLEYLEHAHDDAKYGMISRNPYLDIVIPSILDPSLTPDGKHLMSIVIQYVPYGLKNGDWSVAGKALIKTTVDILSQYMPNLRELIINEFLITPVDLEREYRLTEGCIYHGQMVMDQMLFMRPIPGYGQYKMPVKNLILCGSGTHPGGGVTGLPGFNAAREAMKD